MQAQEEFYNEIGGEGLKNLILFQPGLYLRKE